ncbi:type III pantothenate kinase [uncultured Paraglaciecola sp.]|uniref:type III pantothenate kinase n=1 Tax=uncultured Paraglaciecola sp. TaxID=1765024 RepID=UPI0026024DB8|nr:type III pantothenate kinase [uncultured Paraglaciecola sp.]
MGGKLVLGHYKALLVDIGNTQIKYALVNQSSDLGDVNFCQYPDDLISYIQSAEQLLVSSVGHSSLVATLVELCDQSNIACKVVETESKTLGIQCAYKQFETLGVDRWMAILAAREITPLPVAVIDLGTANTCDIVIDNRHIGGWISPGFSVMRESLLSNTQQVFADTRSPEFLKIGETTQDCVSYGCLASQTGFVLMAEQYLSQHYENYAILVTGGGQNSLGLQKNEKISLFPNLVLRGLSRLLESFEAK